MRFTGLPQIALGSWELYKAKKALREGFLSEEESLSRRKFNQTKLGIGAIKLALIGYSTSAVISPILNNSTFSNIDIGILAAFAAGYVATTCSDVYSAILNDEAVNYKHNQSNLEKNFQIKLNNKNGFELNSGEAYQLYMIGNRLSTGNPFDSFIFNIKEKINNWKSNFNLEQQKDFGILKNSFYKILKNTGIESIMNSIYSKSTIKQESFNTIKKYTDINSIENKEFMEYLKKEHTEISANEDDIKTKLKEINQEAIVNSYQKILIQNLQLFFAQVVMDYNNGNINKDLIMKFNKLNEQNTIKSKNNILFEEYSKIEKISKLMLEDNKLIKDKFKKPEDVLKYLESEFLTKNNSIKFLNFDNMFKLERKAILNKKNGLSKLNDNIYDDKKGCFTEINFDNNIISKIKINQAKLKDKIKNKNLKNE